MKSVPLLLSLTLIVASSPALSQAVPEAKPAPAATPSPTTGPAPSPDPPPSPKPASTARNQETGTRNQEPVPTPPAPPQKKPAAVSTMLPEEIEGFDSYPAALQDLIRKSLALTTQNLRYQFGSSEPKAGGMDCSGTMYRVLMDSGIKDVPRQSDEICRWVMKRSLLYRTEDAAALKDATFTALKPGDLLFWTGTYETNTPRELPISHVMLYLGKRKKDGKPVIFGASEGRTYENERRNGVSVFDFPLPKRGDRSAFYGYGPIPGLDLTTKPAPSAPESGPPSPTPDA